MFKLTKQESERRAEHVEKLRSAWGNVDDAVRAYNEALAPLKEAVEKAVEEYNEAMNEARGFAEDVVSQADEDISDKSERWQESEKGQAVIEWKGEWERISFDDLSTEFPDELSIDEPDHIGELEEVAEEADIS